MEIKSLEELKQYFVEHDYPTYDRNNYDSFIEDQHIEFNTKSIHVTGTNGKGSTANFIREIYLSHGYKVGFYMSPFLYSPLEMISIDNNEISLDKYLSILNPLIDLIEKYHLSSFEIQTIIAYHYFKQENVDLAVIEVGMGGLIDATNILINPVLAIITSISLEHTAYLGTTKSAIADAKAGIIQEGSRVLIGQLDEEATYPIYLRCKKMHCDLHIVNDYHNEIITPKDIHFDYKPYKNLLINTGASYQLMNACIAIEASNILSDLIPLDEKDVRNGLLCKMLPSRMEMIKDNICIDGGHNPDAIDKLLSSLLKITDKPIHVLYAGFKDKNVDSILSLLNRDASSVTLTTFPHPRARTQDDYFLYLDDYEFIPDYKKAIDDIISRYPNDFILITGSLAFSNLARRYLLGLDK